MIIEAFSIKSIQIYEKKKKTKQRKVTCNYSKVIKLISKTKQNPHNLELTEHGSCQTVIN